MSNPQEPQSQPHPQPTTGLTLEELAGAKRLPVNFLATLGVSDKKWTGAVPAVYIPYLRANGQVGAARYRIAQTGDCFRWRNGDKVMPYGLSRRAVIKETGWCLLVEGESDCWTAWYHGIPAIGIPGKGTWRSEWATHFEGIQAYLWVEPEADELIARVRRDIPDLRVIYAPEGTKDLSEAHIRHVGAEPGAPGTQLRDFVDQLKANAPLATDILREQLDDTGKELRERAAAVLEHTDPLELVREAIRAQGYGGDLNPAIIVYLAATSRLLAMRRGTMPVHLLLHSGSSAGKSYTVQIVESILPAEAYYLIDASSPRVLIYDDADLKHRMLVFGEADSLPAGEDNPAASAMRNLCTDHYLHYKVTVRDPETGEFTVLKVNKEGPTVLVTTATKRLGDQMDTRLFTLDVPEDRKKIQAALDTQGELEEQDDLPEPPGDLLAFQGYLQTRAPWRVKVPYAKKLAFEIGKSPAAPRILRDYARLISLVKSVAVLRHTHRKVDDQGRIIATLADYKTVRDLIGQIYEDSATGSNDGVRKVVDAVRVLKAQADLKLATLKAQPGYSLTLKDVGEARINVAKVAERLGISRMTATRHVRIAEGGGWLENVSAQEDTAHTQKDLVLGEALPANVGLPTPDSLDYVELPVEDNRDNTRITGGVLSSHEGFQARIDPKIGEDNRITPFTVSSTPPPLLNGYKGSEPPTPTVPLTVSPVILLSTPVEGAELGHPRHENGITGRITGRITGPVTPTFEVTRGMRDWARQEGVADVDDLNEVTRLFELDYIDRYGKPPVKGPDTLGLWEAFVLGDLREREAA